MDYGNDYSRIPAHMREAMEAYVLQRRPVGSFLKAVIENNLKEACQLADSVNINIIPIYITWFYNNAPSNSWGRIGAYDRWICRADQIKP